MPSILTIDYDQSSQFCRLRHPYNKRFVSWLRGGIRPPSYRRYDDSTKHWYVHLRRLPLVVSMGRRHFGHVDYSSLPEDIQIQLVKNIDNYGPSNQSDFVVTSSPSGPHAVLFVLETAPWEVVEAAYKALAFISHPDRGGCTEDFQRIQKAYEELKKYKKD